MQLAGFQLHAGDALDQQIALAAADVLQQAVAGQFVAAQLQQGIQRGLLGEQQSALFGAAGLAVVLAVLQQVTQFLQANLAAADLRLGALGAGLGGNDQAVGFTQGCLQVGQLYRALAEQLLKLAGRGLGIALGRGNGRAGLEAQQLALGFADLPWRRRQLRFQLGQGFFTAIGLLKKTKGLLIGLLQGLLLGLRQLAIGQAIEAALHIAARRQLGSQGWLGQQAKPEQGGGKQSTQRRHGRFSYGW